MSHGYVDGGVTLLAPSTPTTGPLKRPRLDHALDHSAVLGLVTVLRPATTGPSGAIHPVFSALAVGMTAALEVRLGRQLAVHLVRGNLAVALVARILLAGGNATTTGILELAPGKTAGTIVLDFMRAMRVELMRHSLPSPFDSTMIGVRTRLP